MAERILISGKSNSGKTTLTKNLPPDQTYVIAVDEKPYQFQIPHTNIYGFTNMESFVRGSNVEVEGVTMYQEGVYDKLSKFEEKFGHMPKYLVIDSVSRVFQIAYDNLNEKFPTDNFKLYAALDREIKQLRQLLVELQDNGINVIIISHALYDEKTGTYSMVDSGKFSKSGGFLSIVDHAVFIELKGKKRTIHHKNPSFASRSLLEDLPDSQPIEEYDLQAHIDLIEASKGDNSDYLL